MNRPGIDRVALAVASANVVGILLGVALAIRMATVLDISIDATNGTLLLRFSFFISIFAALVFLCVVFSLVYIWVADKRAGSRISRLFGASVAQAQFMFAFFCFTLLNAIDYLSHNLKPQWDFLRQPEIRLVTVGLYTGIVGSFAFYHMAVLLIHGWSKLRVALLYSIIVIVVVLVITVAIILGSS